VTGAASPEDAAGALAVPIADLKLPARASASLRQAGLTTVGDLAGRDEQALLALAGVGPRTIAQIKRELSALGVELAAPATPPAGGTPPPASDADLTAGRAQTGPATPAPPAAPAEATPAPGAPPAGSPPATGPTAGGGSAPGATVRSGPAARSPRQARPPDEEAIALLNVAGLPVLKRILPAAAAVIAVLVLILVRSRRHRRR
jgi:hypothetical protein